MDEFFADKLGSLLIPGEISESILSRLESSNAKISLSISGITPSLDQESKPSNLRLKQWGIDQKKREKSLQRRLKEKEMKFKEEEEKHKLFMKHQSERMREAYYNNLENMRLKRLEKQRSLQLLLNPSKKQSFLTEKPMFQIIEEKYQTDIALPNVESRKTELAKLRLSQATINQEQLKEHLRWYRSIKQENDERIKRNRSEKTLEDRVNSIARNYSTSMGAKLYKQDLEHKNNYLTEKEKKYEMALKQKNYSKLIRDILPPPQARTQQNFNNESKKLKEVAQKPKFITPWKPKQFAKNPMIPEPTPKRLPQVVDYLALRRQERDIKPISTQINWNIEGDNKIDKVRVISDKVNRQVRRHEMLVSKSLSSMQALRSTEEIDDMLLTSIKAKLDVLQNINKD